MKPVFNYDWIVYKKKRDVLANKLKQAKQKLFNIQPQDLWKMVKFVANTDNCDKAIILNDYCSKYFNDIVSPLSDTDGDMFASSVRCECSPELLCSEKEVLVLLLSLDTTKANLMDLTNYQQSCLRPQPILFDRTAAILLNKISGVVPTEWKLSSAVPIPKVKEVNQPGNYGPISNPLAL